MGIQGQHSNLKDKDGGYKFPSTLTKMLWDIQSGLRLDNLLHKNGTMNPNILVNANFKNPVIVNGVGSTNISGKQPIDKWDFYHQGSTDGCVTLNKNFLTLEAKSGSKRTFLGQNVDTSNAYNNETITVSMKYRAIGNSSDIRVYASIMKSNVKLTNDLGELICDGKWHIFDATYKISELDDLVQFGAITIDICPNTRFAIENANAYGWGNIVDNGDTNVVSEDTKVDIQWVKAELAESCTPFKPRLYQEEFMLVTYQDLYNSVKGVE